MKDDYYKFFWTGDLHQQTFKKTILRRSSSLGEHLSYKTVKVSYLVWILYKTPSIGIWRIVKETPSYAKRVAIYDLSEAFKGNFVCLKLNETESLVLEEFEYFLNKKYGIILESIFETFDACTTTHR